MLFQDDMKDDDLTTTDDDMSDDDSMGDDEEMDDADEEAGDILLRVFPLKITVHLRVQTFQLGQVFFSGHFFLPLFSIMSANQMVSSPTPQQAIHRARQNRAVSIIPPAFHIVCAPLMHNG